MRDHQRAEREERWQDLQDFLIARLAQIGLEEGTEEEAQRLDREAAEAVEEIVDAECRHVVRRLAPFAAAPVEHGEVGPGAEEQVPRLEVAVRARQPMRPRPQAPAPRHRRALDVFTDLGRQQRIRMRIAVEDAHQALAVADQLADPAMIEGRLVMLHGVHLGQEAPELLGAGHVEVAKRSLQQALEIEPVQGAVHFLDELEELARVRDRHQLAPAAHDTDIDALRVPREAVVGVVAVERLPGAVGRVVVAEPLGRPRARHDERARDAAHDALDLERNAVPEALRVVGLVGAGLQGPEVEDLDGRGEHARQVARELAPIDARRASRRGHERLAVAPDRAGETAATAPNRGSRGEVTSRTSKIGVRVPCRTDSATEPKISRPIPPRPWLVMMMRSIFSTEAASTIVGAAGPYQTAVRTRVMPHSRSPAATPFR